MNAQGYLPCFSEYRHSEYPIENLYQSSSNVEKLKKLVSAFIDTPNPKDLCRSIGRHDIQPIRPDSSEGKRLIGQFSLPENLYRIDYGNTPFRIIFSLSNKDRLAKILAIDTKHDTFNGKHRR